MNHTMIVAVYASSLAPVAETADLAVRAYRSRSSAGQSRT
jgi:hypothetical protein